MVRVELTQGKFAVVDQADYPMLAQRKWLAHRDRRGHWYAETSISGKQVPLGRLLLGARPGQIVTYLNRNTLDNRRENLCLCTRREVAHRQHHARRDGIPYRGVKLERDTGRWTARIRLKRGETYLGSFDTAELAARVYDTAARLYQGQHALVNFPGEEMSLPGPVAVRIIERCRQPAGAAEPLRCVRCEIMPDKQNPLLGDTCSWCLEEMVSTPYELAQWRAEGIVLSPALLMAPPGRYEGRDATLRTVGSCSTSPNHLG